MIEVSAYTHVSITIQLWLMVHFLYNQKMFTFIELFPYFMHWHSQKYLPHSSVYSFTHRNFLSDENLIKKKNFFWTTFGNFLFSDKTIPIYLKKLSEMTLKPWFNIEFNKKKCFLLQSHKFPIKVIEKLHLRHRWLLKVMSYEFYDLSE